MNFKECYLLFGIFIKFMYFEHNIIDVSALG